MDKCKSTSEIKENQLAYFLKFQAYYITDNYTETSPESGEFKNGLPETETENSYCRLILFTKAPLTVSTTNNRNLMNSRVYRNLITTKTYKFTPVKNTHFTNFLSSIKNLKQLKALNELTEILIRYTTKFHIAELRRNVFNNQNKFYIFPLVFKNNKYLSPSEILEQLNTDRDSAYTPSVFPDILTNNRNIENIPNLQSNENSIKTTEEQILQTFTRAYSYSNKKEIKLTDSPISDLKISSSLLIKLNKSTDLEKAGELIVLIKTMVLEDILISIKIILESIFINNFISLLGSLSSINLISDEMKKILNVLKMSILTESTNNRLLLNIILDINYFQSDLFTIFCCSFDRKLDKHDQIRVQKNRTQLYDMMRALLDTMGDTGTEQVFTNNFNSRNYNENNKDSVCKLSLIGIYFNKFISVTQHFLENPSSREHKLSLEGLIGMNHSISCSIFHNHFKQFVNKKHLPTDKLDDRFMVLTSKDEAKLGKQRTDINTNFVLMNEVLPEKDKKDIAVTLCYYTMLSRSIIGFIIRFSCIINKDNFRNISIFSHFYSVCLLEKHYAKGFTHLITKDEHSDFLKIPKDLFGFINTFSQPYNKEDFYKIYGTFIMGLNESTFQVLENVGDSILNFYIVYNVMKSAICLNEREIRNSIFGRDNVLRSLRNSSWKDTVSVIYNLISNNTLNQAVGTKLSMYLVRNGNHAYRQYSDSFECFIGGLFGINAVNVLFRPIKNMFGVKLRRDIKYFDIIEEFINDNIFNESMLNKYRINKHFNKSNLKSLFRYNKKLIMRRIFEKTGKEIKKEDLELKFNISTNFDFYECVIKLKEMKIGDGKDMDQDNCIEKASKMAYQYLEHFIKGKVVNKEDDILEIDDEKEGEIYI